MRFSLLKYGFGFFLAFGQICYGQVLIKGRVIDQKGDPAPFVNIGIIDTYIGTISELNGDFELKIPKEFDHRNIIFSNIGYERVSIPISTNTGKWVEIVLEEKALELDEIVVTEKRLNTRIKRVGNRYTAQNRFMVDTTYSGSAIAQMISSPFDTCIIHWVNLGYTNGIEDLKMRINFKAVDEQGLPGEVLFKEEIIVDLVTIDGFQRISFDGYYILIKEHQFFIEFEPLVLKKDRQAIHDKITRAIAETPYLIRYSDYGEILIDDPELDLDFIQFKVSLERKNTTFYRASSFSKWYSSEELALSVGLSDYTEINEEKSLDERIYEKINQGKQDDDRDVSSSVDTYENDGKILYSTLADHLRRIASLAVLGPGDEVQVFVRGIGSMSIYHSNEPIFVIDGLNIGRGYASAKNSVDINKIKYIRVLKGLSQTVIYGEEGKNGVIIIRTTKRKKSKKQKEQES